MLSSFTPTVGVTAQGRPPSFVVSAICGAITAGAGLLAALCSFGSWVQSRLVFAPESASAFSWFEGAETRWVLGPIPDGVPMVALSLLLAGVGAAVALRSLMGPPNWGAATILAALSGANVVLAGVAFVWVIISYGALTSGEYEGLVGAGEGMVFASMAVMGAGACSLLAAILLLTLKPRPTPVTAQGLVAETGWGPR